MKQPLIHEAIVQVFESANECDSNGEQANVVDGLFAIARSIGRLAAVLERHQGAVTQSEETL